MSIFLRPGQIKVRDDNGEFTSINVMAEISADEIINDIEAAGQEVIESIPSDYTALTEEVDELNERIDDIEPGLSDTAKAALLNCFQHVAWDDGDGQDYYNALRDALAGEEKIPQSITATYNQQKIIDSGSSLNVLRNDLTVIAAYEDGTSAEILSYDLSGTLSDTRSIITVTYKGLTAQITVVVAPANRWVNDVLTIPSSEISQGGINGVAPSYVNTQTTYRRSYVGAWIDIDPRYSYKIKAIPSTSLTLQVGIDSINALNLGGFAKGNVYVNYTDTGWQSNEYVLNGDGSITDKVMIWINCRKSDNSQFGSATVSRFEITRTLL